VIDSFQSNLTLELSLLFLRTREMLLLLVLTIVCLLAYKIYKWLTLYKDYFERRGIQHLKPTFAIGNTGGMYFRKYRTTDFLQNLYKKFPNKKIFGMFDFRQPFFFLRDPEIIKQLTVKDFDHFQDRCMFIDDADDMIFGKSLPMLRGRNWRDMRATFSPAFTVSKMRQLIALILETSTSMVDYVTKRVESCGDIEMWDLFSRLTIDAIASFGFGCEVNSFEDENNDFHRHSVKITNLGSLKFGLKIMATRFFPGLMKMLDINLTDSSSVRFFRKMVMNNVSTREKEGIFRSDMINTLINIKKGYASNKEENQSDAGFATVRESHIGTKQVDRQWTDDDLVAQFMIFILGAYETTTATLAFLTHELAVNTNIQERLYEEVYEVDKNLNGDPLSYEVLCSMKYLEMVVSETLRHWPAGPFTDRICTKDYEYDDGDTKFKFEKGITFWIPVYALHHDEKYFPNPSKFDPDRFSEENKINILPGTYIPFGTGPRNCIGSRYALLQIKSIIYHLLLHFKMELNGRSQIPMKVAKQPLAMSPEKGVHLKLSLRK